MNSSTATTKNLVLFALKTNAKPCKFDKRNVFWILELLSVTVGKNLQLHILVVGKNRQRDEWGLLTAKSLHFSWFKAISLISE